MLQYSCLIWNRDSRPRGGCRWRRGDNCRSYDAAMEALSALAQSAHTRPAAPAKIADNGAGMRAEGGVAAAGTLRLA